MAILITGDVPGQTKQGYDGMLAALEGPMKAAGGFILHAAYEDDRGWHIIEVWESQEAAAQFFAKYIHPNLPPGVKPQRKVHTLHAIARG